LITASVIAGDRENDRPGHRLGHCTNPAIRLA
jgi:hypothetical protein